MPTQDYTSPRVDAPLQEGTPPQQLLDQTTAHTNEPHAHDTMPEHQVVTELQEQINTATTEEPTASPPLTNMQPPMMPTSQPTRPRGRPPKVHRFRGNPGPRRTPAEQTCIDPTPTQDGLAYVDVDNAQAACTPSANVTSPAHQSTAEHTFPFALALLTRIKRPPKKYVASSGEWI